LLVVSTVKTGCVLCNGEVQCCKCYIYSSIFDKIFLRCVFFFRCIAHDKIRKRQVLIKQTKEENKKYQRKARVMSYGVTFIKFFWSFHQKLMNNWSKALKRSKIG